MPLGAAILVILIALIMNIGSVLAIFFALIDIVGGILVGIFNIIFCIVPIYGFYAFIRMIFSEDKPTWLIKFLISLGIIFGVPLLLSLISSIFGK